MDPLTLLIGQAVVTGTLSSLRPALIIAILQLYIYIMGLVQGSPIPMPDGTSWMVHEVSIALVIGWAIAEHFMWSDPSFEEVDAVKYLKLGIGTLMAAMGPILLGASSLDPAAWQQVGNTVALYTSGPSGAFFGLIGVAITIAAIAATVTGVLRSWILSTLDAIDVPTQWIRWFESGGAASITVSILLLPVLALGIAALLVVMLSVGATSTWLARKKLDRKRRTPCPNCEHLVRKEASLCAKCRTPLSPSRVLAKEDDIAHTPTPLNTTSG